MKQQRQRRIPVACLCLGAGLCGTADADVYGQLTVATDYLFRGVSQTMSGAALQGELGFEHHSGVYGYVWASNVRFDDGAPADDGARIEVNTGAGYVRSLAKSVSLDVGATFYLFPGTEPGFDYDYMEWFGTVSVDERHRLTFGYSDNVFNTGADGTFLLLGTGHELNEHFGLFVELGLVDLEQALGTSYEYAEVAVAGKSRAINWRLGYIATSDRARELFEESTVEDRIVLALSLHF